MESITLLCSKGCGGSITVGEEEIKLAQEHGVPLVAAHEVCPKDRLRGSTYNVVVQVWRERSVEEEEYDNLRNDPAESDGATELWVVDEDTDTGDQTRYMVKELLATVGGTTIADDFSSAVPELSKQMGEKWQSVIGMGNIIDGN